MVAGHRSARTLCLCMVCLMGNGGNVAGREGPVSGANGYVVGAFATRSCNYMPFRFALSVCLSFCVTAAEPVDGL